MRSHMYGNIGVMAAMAGLIAIAHASKREVMVKDGVETEIEPIVIEKPAEPVSRQRRRWLERRGLA